MKVFRTIVAVAAIAATTVLAQNLFSKGALSAETVQPAAPANIGIIDSSAFSDEKNGISRVMAGMRQLDVKFEPLRAELRGMRDRLNTMRADLQKKRGIQDAQTTARQTEEADQLEVQIKRKAEDAAANYQKETRAVLEPLQADIANALTAYAQSKGITLVIDANRVPILYAASSLDITRDFINEYNRTHPGAAGPAPAPARPTPATARPSPSTAKPTPARPGRP
ncbi:MAG TPA: OmpH family outer membrane protein [Pyrinomonadaceae bacterium]|nr:OmpH family outer membrane protein [Pyrinomonadaceae bacterium]